ncbi:putative bifunctional diguanylate cyclase/phosphodiesterase [Luteimonas kalidii]|uniref:EAL domain-containing protein n=1 Tax=Luteimonas kalidii TaxID=3042025 RepID=A0ABT6JX90_9GAMM|nr:EAL domain-containing protein [Luteimonas kalidii]MDH5835312.1 EAL domain-containing protein [Luteimonas kalidii]
MGAGPRLSTAILGSRFGRRLFVLFCLAALVPASVVFWMTYRTATADAESSRRQVLRTGAKNYALGVFERLQLAGGALATVDADEVGRARGDPLLALYFSDMQVRPLDASVAHPATLGAGDARLRLERRGSGTVPILVRADGDRLLVGTLAPDFLWGLSGEMSQDMRICLYAGRERLFCGGHPGTEAGDRLVAEHWDLFLKAGFDSAPWTAVSVAGAGHGLRHYRGVVVPAAAAVLLLALLLSSLQIRRVLVPLSDLLRRIQRVEGGHGHVSRQAGEDEFGLLTRTFDAMQQRIGRQIDTLRILSDIDRLLLGGASLDQLLDLVARRLRHVAGPVLVCIVVPPLEQTGAATLYLLRREGEAMEQLRCGDGGNIDGSPQGRWLPVASLDPGVVREACKSEGVCDLFVLVPASVSRPVRVLLGYAARPVAMEQPLAQAAKLAESIPVALAFEERRRQLVYQARHDSLTQLPNRLATFEAVAAAIEDAARDGARFAVAFLDLDRFKSINDGLGHGSGDELLVGVSRCIRDSLSAGDFVGRFGGDEFCLILFGAGSAGEAEHAMQRVTGGLSRPVQAGGREFLQTFSAGIALYPAHGRDASTLIRNADLAMYQGKRAGGRGLRVFEPDMDAAAHARLRMENDLRDAIAAGAIEVHYQPRVDSRDGSIAGAEALARWTHPQSGPVPPSTFIALAEDTGLIDDLGALVLRKACAQLAQWNAAGLRLPQVSVNVSGHQLRSRRLAETVRRAIEAAGIAPALLELEITETALVQDREAAEHQLGRVRSLGTTVAIDDFGTGYSSLAYLAALPFDTLKIDRSFVIGIGDGHTPMSAIVRATIGLARELGKHVVAEGVETMDDVRHLARWGCVTIQGYVYHRPMSAAALTGLLQARTSND